MTRLSLETHWRKLIKHVSFSNGRCDLPIEAISNSNILLASLCQVVSGDMFKFFLSLLTSELWLITLVKSWKFIVFRAYFDYTQCWKMTIWKGSNGLMYTQMVSNQTLCIGEHYAKRITPISIIVFELWSSQAETCSFHDVFPEIFGKLQTVVLTLFIKIFEKFQNWQVGIGLSYKC